MPLSTSLLQRRDTGLPTAEHGVKPEDIHWVVTAKDSAKGQTGDVSKCEKLLPPKNVTIEHAPKDNDESALLLEGKLDAILHPAEPQAYVDRHPKVDRLFSDPRKVERAYFKKTGILKEKGKGKRDSLPRFVVLAGGC